MNALVTCFSASGSTARLAQTLAAAADAKRYEIKPAVPYERKDLNWMDKKSRSTVEMQDPNSRPAHLVVPRAQHHRQLSGCLRFFR